MTTFPDISPQSYDRAFLATHRSPLLNRLTAEAMGDQYPAEVQPFSSCCWWLLGEVVAGLRMRPGDTLLDLGCGRGGPGLWTARALGVRLVGLDWSPAAVSLAAGRAPDFVPDGRAEFHVGTFADTGLASGSAHAAMSIDALIFAPDKDAALREAHRVLVPGGRLVFTGVVPRDRPTAWDGRLTDAGFTVESRTPQPHARAHWQRMYTLWREHADELRTELGDAVADDLLTEAGSLPELDQRDWLVFTARRS